MENPQVTIIYNGKTVEFLTLETAEKFYSACVKAIKTGKVFELRWFRHY